MAVKLGAGFTTPPGRLQAPAEFTAAPEVEAPDVREIVVSLCAAGAGWMVPSLYADAQTHTVRVPAPRAVDLARPRLRDERHFDGRRFPRRPS